jgi:hypothetical protein
MHTDLLDTTRDASFHSNASINGKHDDGDDDLFTSPAGDERIMISPLAYERVEAVPKSAVLPYF